MATTVSHGIDQSGLSTARPDKGHYSSLFHETDTGAVRVYNEAEGEWEPFDYIAFEYDVSGGDSGALGVHAIDGARIPAGTIVLDGLIDVITTFASAGDTATIAIRMQAAGDLVAAVAINHGSNPWDAGLHDVIPVGSAATAIKATADRQVIVDVGVQAVTAGKLRGFLRCLRSEQTVTEEESSTSSSSNTSSSSTSSNSSSSSSTSSSSSNSSSSSSSSSST